MNKPYSDHCPYETYILVQIIDYVQVYDNNKTLGLVSCETLGNLNIKFTYC